MACKCHTPSNCKLKALSHQNGILTAPLQHSKRIADCRGARCAVTSNVVCILCHHLEHNAAGIILKTCSKTKLRLGVCTLHMFEKIYCTNDKTNKKRACNECVAATSCRGRKPCESI